MSVLALWNRHHAESGPASAHRATANHLIDFVDVRVDFAREAIAAITLADNLDAKIRDHVTERGGWL